jgi:hypothetical protein
MVKDLSELKIKNRLLGFLLLTMIASGCLYSQETDEEDAIDALLDELFFNDEQFIDDMLATLGPHDFIYTILSFNSNTFFSGRESGIDQYNWVPQISYYHKSGFTASLSGIYYETFDPSWDFTNVSLGYFNTLGKQKELYYYGGYTRYFYSNVSGTFTNSIDLSVGIWNNKRTLGTKISASYLFGSDQSIQLVSNSYASLTLVKHRNFRIKFRPQLNLIIAQQTIALEQLVIVGDSMEIQVITNDVFDLLNTRISFPIYFTTRSWDFEAGYHINLPNPVATESNLDSTGFFAFSVGYLIDLGNK